MVFWDPVYFPPMCADFSISAATGGLWKLYVLLYSSQLNGHISSSLFVFAAFLSPQAQCEVWCLTLRPQVDWAAPAPPLHPYVKIPYPEIQEKEDTVSVLYKKRG